MEHADAAWAGAQIKSLRAAEQTREDIAAARASGLLPMARLLGQTAGAALVSLAFALSPDTGIALCLDLSVAITLAALLVSTTRRRGA